VQYLSHSVPDTERIAADLARTLPPNSTLALHGHLGAGKTQFVRGLLVGLGGNPRTVSSPTYVLLNVYDTGRLPLFHLDAYRVAGPDDFDAIGFSELLEQGGIVVVEWASRVADLLPSDAVHIHLDPISESDRRITISHKGDKPPREGDNPPRP
jgi:tRNA threonylcarbamoyladenosine biosynthesis protein TsaE